VQNYKISQNNLSKIPAGLKLNTIGLI
jgi:hypothetical protein